MGKLLYQMYILIKDKLFLSAGKLKNFKVIIFLSVSKMQIPEREQLDFKRKIYEYFPLGTPSSAS